MSRDVIPAIDYFTTQEERQLALDFAWGQAAIVWKRRTGGTLEDARRMRWVFLQWAVAQLPEIR